MSLRRSGRPNSGASSNTPRPFPLWGSASTRFYIHVPAETFCDFHDHSAPDIRRTPERNLVQFAPPPSELDVSSMGTGAAALFCEMWQLADHDTTVPFGIQYAVELRESETRVLRLLAPCLDYAMQHARLLRQMGARLHAARRARTTQLVNTALSLSQLQAMWPVYCSRLLRAETAHFGVLYTSGVGLYRL